MVNEFTYNEAALGDLTRTLSVDRLATYSRESGGDRAKAIRLYTWNTAVSSAFYGPLQGLEVALRNAIHIELSRAYGGQWFDNPKTGLSATARDQIDRAKRELQRERKPDDPPHIVAALSFGFWERLLSHGPRGKQNYEMLLWRPALHKAFPHAERRRRQTIHRPILELRNLRNRIAHHEPVFRRNLEADYADILRVIGWICPVTKAWVSHQCQVTQVLAARP